MKPKRISLALALALSISGAVWDRTMAQQKPSTPEALLGSALHQEEAEGNLEAAIALYKKLISEHGTHRALAAKAQLHIGLCYEKLGITEARKAYQQVVNEYADQPEEARLARARLDALGGLDRTMRVRRVWEGPDVDLLGAPTRDGRYLTIQEGATTNLAVRDLATGQLRLLTKKDRGSGEFALRSVPSPDGKMVAYVWYSSKIHYNLRIVGWDGSNPRVLCADPAFGYMEVFDWSPDGKNILVKFQQQDKGSQIALVSVVEGSVRIMKSFDREAPQRARFSPDGRKIAYAFPQQTGSSDHDIFVLPVEGGRETPVVQHPANDVLFDWTPDGKRILFGSNRSGTTGAWWIPITDGKPDGAAELVKPDLGQDVSPLGFTRDGSYYYEVRTGMSDVYIAGLDVSSGKALAPPILATQRFAGSNSKPDCSYDGRQLVFLSQRGPGVWGARAICIRDAESGEVREIPSKLDRVVDVRWFPDNRSVIVVAEHPSGVFGPFRIDVQTGDFERVNLQNPSGWGWAFSPDGKTIYYHRGATVIVARELETGQEKVLYSVDKVSCRLRAGVTLSRDGQRLAIAVSDVNSGSKILKVIPAAGGEAIDLPLGDVQMPFPGLIAWTPDGQSLLFLKQPIAENPLTELWQIPVKGGEPRRLELTAKNMRDLRVHPDGRHVAYTIAGDKSEVWAMENFLSGKK